MVGDKVILTTAFSEGQPKPKSGGGFGGGKGGPGGGGGFGKGGGAPKETYQFKIVCLDRATGKTAWEKVAKEARPTIPTHGSNTYATESPVSDGQYVYAYFGMTGVYCYDMAGKLLWTKDLGAYPMQFGWGTGSSPTLFGDKLYIQCDNDQESFLVALDKKTGDELWRKPREEKSNWSTPYIWRNKLRTELVTAGGAEPIPDDGVAA